MCVCVCQRQGLGKLRHIETQALWVQQKVRSGVIELRKVRGEVNPADLFTKSLTSRERIESLVKLLSCCYRSGRAEGAPQLRRDAAHCVEDPLEACAVDGGESFEIEAPMHDPNVLPHHYNDDDIKSMFPRAKVAWLQGVQPSSL